MAPLYIHVCVSVVRSIVLFVESVSCISQRTGCHGKTFKCLCSLYGGRLVCLYVVCLLANLNGFQEKVSKILCSQSPGLLSMNS